MTTFLFPFLCTATGLHSKITLYLYNDNKGFLLFSVLIGKSRSVPVSHDRVTGASKPNSRTLKLKQLHGIQLSFTGASTVKMSSVKINSPKSVLVMANLTPLNIFTPSSTAVADWLMVKQTKKSL